MPHVASATGELILRKFVMSSGAPASGQGDTLNKVLTVSAGNDWRMVNAPPYGKGVSFGTVVRRETRVWSGALLTGVGRLGDFDATFGLCQQP
jgi:hypothetical protein